ncbi:glycosyltransferase family 2 protein [Arhodomonas sp. AD133]|uniref:glycosyltransferase family 2 protein n=1 Tax=Arhodomonas sp. AD133 TaxID=3415009 RepID=UPI003EBBDF5D
MTRIGNGQHEDASVCLTVVMPVYNEAGVIGEVLRAWLGAADTLGVPYRLVVYDDGSIDDSPRLALECMDRRPDVVRVVRQANRGHGATLLRGYREAKSRWVLQVDGDGEVGSEILPELWRRREAHDLVVVARRYGRRPLERRIASAGARWLLKGLFDGRIQDPNSPCRLMRRDAVAPLLERLAPTAAVPNLTLLAWAHRSGLRIAQVSSAAGPARAGGLKGMRLWRLAGRAIWEIVEVRLRRNALPLPRAGS